MSATKLNASNLFCAAVGGILVSTAILKGMARVSIQVEVARLNPLLHVDNGMVLIISSIVELCAGIYLLLNRNSRNRLWLVNCLASCLLAYRICLRLVGGTPNCGCLGIATQWVPFLGNYEAAISFGVIVIMLLGSGWLLCKHSKD